MKPRTRLIILINLILILAGFTWSVIHKENTINSGQLVLFRLAPVDPRSLMQGDYMDLRFEIPSFCYDSIGYRKGYLIVIPDSTGVVRIIRSQDSQTPLSNGEIAIKYKQERYGEISPGASSYFFEEGQADSFSEACYGGFRVDSKGSTVLTGLYDENRLLIRPGTEKVSEKP